MKQEKIWANTYKIKNTFMGRIPHDSDLLEQINSFCMVNDIRSGIVNIIGAVKEARLGYYSQNRQNYRTLDGENLTGGLEILSCTGNVSIKDGKPFAHLHLIVSDSQGNALGGHLMPGTVVYAGEFIIQEFEGKDFIRGWDKTTGLPLWLPPED